MLSTLQLVVLVIGLWSCQLCHGEAAPGLVNAKTAAAPDLPAVVTPTGTASMGSSTASLDTLPTPDAVGCLGGGGALGDQPRINLIFLVQPPRFQIDRTHNQMVVISSATQLGKKRLHLQSKKRPPKATGSLSPCPRVSNLMCHTPSIDSDQF